MCINGTNKKIEEEEEEEKEDKKVFVQRTERGERTTWRHFSLIFAPPKSVGRTLLRWLLTYTTTTCLWPIDSDALDDDAAFQTHTAARCSIFHFG